MWNLNKKKDKLKRGKLEQISTTTTTRYDDHILIYEDMVVLVHVLVQYLLSETCIS